MRDSFCRRAPHDKRRGVGATIIKKQFIVLSRAERGVDATFSFEPDELTRPGFRNGKRLAGSATGPTKVGEVLRTCRCCLYITDDMEAGDVLARRIGSPSRGLKARVFRGI